MAGVRYSRLSFADLQGWADDDHRAALDTFARSFSALSPEWPQIPKVGNAKDYFTDNLTPVLIEDGQPMLFTGYYEPEFGGSPVQKANHRYPAYAVPDDFQADAPYLTRREIDRNGALANRGLELAWFADPVDVFFLQVQGSGRVRFADGRVIRLGFAAKNGHPYTSIGRSLIARGALGKDQVSPETIRNWVMENPDAGRKLLWQNESYVFFRRIDDVPASEGPLGALGVSVTAGRSIAVDPDFTPLGAPVWIEKAGETPMHRLMVAQDTGSAIKGAQRADIFCGTGDTAGQLAGAINHGGRMIALLPHHMAHRLCQGAG